MFPHSSCQPPDFPQPNSPPLPPPPSETSELCTPISPLRGCSSFFSGRPRSALPLSPPHFEDPPGPFGGGGDLHHQATHLHSSMNTQWVTEGLHDLSLSSGPPPGKVRRRNALTEGDTFSLAQHLQKLENLNNKAISTENATRTLNTDLNKLSLSPVKRKKAVSRDTSRQLGHFLQPKKQMSITLHEDIETLCAQEPVPKSIVEQYLKKETNALILYKPPEKLVEEILSKQEQQELDQIKVSPSRGNKKRSRTQDEDEMELE